MGMPGIWEILIILMVLLVLFGGKKIRSMGSDLGESLKGFKKAIKDEDTESKSASEKPTSDSKDK
ncbi:twin-arginine translocase TatA/TatE family subunit [Gammaproteobacteria bacterium]|jgi:sec-independent protein translocase protein TatA|nr:twin-arginine translocase TatA/TatE family subunit [Gammaproteobacteria bacterium]|tara:strand:+ start:677 stop:871 length:195 start_codon:yes stop_codon:yes gene_type:complete